MPVSNEGQDGDDDSKAPRQETSTSRNEAGIVHTGVASTSILSNTKITLVEDQPRSHHPSQEKQRIDNDDEIVCGKVRAFELAPVLPPDNAIVVRHDHDSNGVSNTGGGRDGDSTTGRPMREENALLTSNDNVAENMVTVGGVDSPTDGVEAPLPERTPPIRRLISPGAVAVPGTGVNAPTSTGIAQRQQRRQQFDNILDDGTFTTGEIRPLDAINVLQDNEALIQQRIQERTIDALNVIPVGAGNHNPAMTFKGRKSFMIVLLMVVGVSLMAIVVGTVFRGGKERDDNDELLPTESPVMMNPPHDPKPYSDLELAKEFFTPISDRDVLQDESSSQYQAMLWLLNDDSSRLFYNVTSISTTRQGTAARASTDDTLQTYMDHPSYGFLLERYIIAVIYYTLGGPTWNNIHNFLSETSVCSWHDDDGVYGIGCSHELEVHTVALYGNNITGTFPSELSKLKRLNGLALSSSYGLHGTIPTTLGDLRDLRLLTITNTQFSGPIPTTLANLRNLDSVWLPQNIFTGIVPSNLFQNNLGLQRFSVASNLLSGTIPESQATKSEESEFQHMVFFNNAFTGIIPESIYIKNPNLQALGLGWNQLSGTLSSYLGKLTDLSYFDADVNQLTGALPTEIGLLSDLESLYLEANQFSGFIPSEIGLLTRLDLLTLSHNYFNGNVPTELSQLSCNFISFHGNNLTGSLDMFCDKDALLTKIGADCLGDDPLLECSCCTTCCATSSSADTSDNVDCINIVEQVCEIEKSSFEDTNGYRYNDNAGAKCDCVDDASETAITPTDNSINNWSNVTLSCSDNVTQCQFCNQEGTVCAINVEYGVLFDKDGGTWDLYSATFQYTRGPFNETVVVFQNKYVPQVDGWDCNVMVDGQLCDACYLMRCSGDYFFGYAVRCENIFPDLGHMDLCNPGDEFSNSPLALFALQDPWYRNGCPPRLYPV